MLVSANVSKMPMELNNDESKKRERHDGEDTDDKAKRNHRRVEESQERESQSGEALDKLAERKRKKAADDEDDSD